MAYLRTLRYKCITVLKMTVGVWDSQMLHSFSVRHLFDKFADPEAEVVSAASDLISILGKSHCLFWQLFPLTIVFAKLGEAVNEAPTSIENMKARQGGSELPHSAHHPVVGRAQSESPAPLVEGVGGVAGAAIAREAPYAPLWVAATRLDPGTKVGEEAARLSTPAG